MESCVPGRYQTLRTIPEFECDFNLRLTAGGLLRLVQEVSTRHCTLWPSSAPGCMRISPPGRR